MNLTKQAEMPAYTDGYFLLYDIVDKAEDDQPVHQIAPRLIGGVPVKVWFRELAVYDRTRATLEQSDVAVSLKLAIPKWKGISSGCVCVIQGVQHRIYNCAEVVSRQGYPETELTLTSVEIPYEVRT